MIFVSVIAQRSRTFHFAPIPNLNVAQLKKMFFLKKKKHFKASFGHQLKGHGFFKVVFQLVSLRVGFQILVVKARVFFVL